MFALLNEPDEPGVTPAAAPMHLESLLSSAARAGNARRSIEEMVTNLPSLFASDHELCLTALRHLEGSPLLGAEPVRWESDAKNPILARMGTAAVIAANHEQHPQASPHVGVNNREYALNK